MWVIAGPNGAEKSSVAENFMADLNHINLIKLNADERSAPDTGVQGDAPSVPMMQSASCMIHRHVRTPLSMSAGSVLACRCEADLGHGWVTSEFGSQRVSRFRVKGTYNSF